MTDSDLQKIIDDVWEQRDSVGLDSAPALHAAVDAALDGLDSGRLRVARKIDGAWHVNQWLKKAVLLSFRLNDMTPIPGGPGPDTSWWDKVPSKFAGWGEAEFRQAGFRAVPNCIVRRSAYIAPGVILMPCFVNLGAHVASGTMIDTWATVGSCAQIGRDVHISGGVGIGGVLEPPNARPVIIEDGAFLGSRSIVVEGVIVEKGAVLGANTTLSASVPIIDVTGSEPIPIRGRVPANAVIVPGTRPKEFPSGIHHLQAPLLIGYRSESTDRKTSLNDALRVFEVEV